jgi:hypothetical protein
MSWDNYALKVSNNDLKCSSKKENDICSKQKGQIEPWLSTLFQSEHLALLIGNGFTTAVASKCKDVTAVEMKCNFTDFPYEDELKKAANNSAKRTGRKEANIEDQIRVANDLIKGLEILGYQKLKDTKSRLLDLIGDFIEKVSKTEEGIKEFL